VVSVFRLNRAHDLGTVASPAPVKAAPVRKALPRAAAPVAKVAAAKPAKRREPVAAGDWEEF
jgi:hypothetical protein